MKIFTELASFGNAAIVLHEGFEYHARIMSDDNADLSWLGEFSETKAAKYSIEHEPYDHSTFKYFNAENVSNMKEARQNYARAITYGESWSMYCVVVHVSKKGVKLATASLHGIESDSGDAFFIDTANELASEALKEARAKLDALKQD